jgi:membrane dipeptidase
MNRLGMIIDGSHSSDAAIEQMIALSKTPVVLSHHGPKAIFDHPRNIDDALMRRLARSGGVMFMNTLFLRAMTSSDARDSIEERQKGWETLSGADRRRLVADRTAAHGKEPVPFADFELFMRSMLHAIKVMGVDHVGLGADWDGGGGLTEMKDIVPLPLITARLRKEGFGEGDIAKIMSGNLLRVMRAAEKQAAR